MLAWRAGSDRGVAATATAMAPCCLAISATTGAAPRAVAPPIAACTQQPYIYAQVMITVKLTV